MAESKNIKTRIIHKHDIEANWKLATNFIPKQGEIIVYDKDDNYEYERFKIGDGVTNVNNLPFGHVPSNWNEIDADRATYIQNKPNIYAADENIYYSSDSFSKEESSIVIGDNYWQQYDDNDGYYWGGSNNIYLNAKRNIVVNAPLVASDNESPDSGLDYGGGILDLASNFSGASRLFGGYELNLSASDYLKLSVGDNSILFSNGEISVNGDPIATTNLILQPNWDITDQTSKNYILNKPTISTDENNKTVIDGARASITINGDSEEETQDIVISSKNTVGKIHLTGKNGTGNVFIYGSTEKSSIQFRNAWLKLVGGKSSIDLDDGIIKLIGTTNINDKDVESHLLPSYDLIEDNGKILSVKDDSITWIEYETDRLTPKITESDNGKVLAVKNGQWEVEDFNSITNKYVETDDSIFTLEVPYEGTPINFQTGWGDSGGSTTGEVSVKIKTFGKNLFNHNLNLKEVTYTGRTGVQGTRWGYEIKLAPGTYTATLISDDSTGVYWYGVVNDQYGNFVDTNVQLCQSLNNQTPKTFTINEGDILYWYEGSTGLTLTQAQERLGKCKVQLEKGEEATSYEPYKGEEKIFNLHNNESITFTGIAPDMTFEIIGDYFYHTILSYSLTKPQIPFPRQEDENKVLMVKDNEWKAEKVDLIQHMGTITVVPRWDAEFGSWCLGDMQQTFEGTFSPTQEMSDLLEASDIIVIKYALLDSLHVIKHIGSINQQPEIPTLPSLIAHAYGGSVEPMYLAKEVEDTIFDKENSTYKCDSVTFIGYKLPF